MTHQDGSWLPLHTSPYKAWRAGTGLSRGARLGVHQWLHIQTGRAATESQALVPELPHTLIPASFSLIHDTMFALCSPTHTWQQEKWSHSSVSLLGRAGPSCVPRWPGQQVSRMLGPLEYGHEDFIVAPSTQNYYHLQKPCILLMVSSVKQLWSAGLIFLGMNFSHFKPLPHLFWSWSHSSLCRRANPGAQNDQPGLASQA